MDDIKISHEAVCTWLVDTVAALDDNTPRVEVCLHWYDEHWNLELKDPEGVQIKHGVWAECVVGTDSTPEVCFELAHDLIGQIIEQHRTCENVTIVGTISVIRISKTGPGGSTEYVVSFNGDAAHGLPYGRRSRRDESAHVALQALAEAWRDDGFLD